MLKMLNYLDIVSIVEWFADNLSQKFKTWTIS